MGRRGPAPTPTRLKEVRGNPGKRKISKLEPKPQPIAPEIPAWMDPENYNQEQCKEIGVLKFAKEYWEQEAEKLERLGLFSEIDQGTFAGICLNYGKWVHAELMVIKHGSAVKMKGSGYIQQHPYVSIANSAYKEYRLSAAEFGLTPASRTRIDVKTSEEGGNSFKEFLNRGKTG